MVLPTRCRPLSPASSAICRQRASVAGKVGQLQGAIDDKHGLAVHADVTGIAERRQKRLEVRAVIDFAGIILLEQHALGLTVPDAGPGFVSPAQAER